MESKEKCPNCNNDAKPSHPCPYGEEINGDNTSLCNCCSDCEYQCCMDI